MKRILCISLISIICVFSIVPFIENDFVYADSIPEGWTNPTTTQELADAFRVYCKSRNLIIDGSGLDVVTTWTTNTFQSTCNKVGIDITALQSQIAYKTDGNTGLKWLFTATGVSAYNRIFAEFLQNNNLEVGDSANETDNSLYNGHYYTYLNKTCLCYEGINTSGSFYLVSNLTKQGTSFPYTTNDLISLGTESGNSVNFPYSSNYSPTWKIYYYDQWTSGGNTYRAWFK